MAETGWLYSESSAAVNVSVLDLPRPAITLDQTKRVIHCSAPPSVNCSSFSLHRETHPEPLAVESTAQHAVAFTGVSMTEGLKYTCRCQLTASGWLLNSTFSLPVSKEAGGFEMWLIVVTAGALVLVFSAAALCFCKMRRGTARMDTQIWSGPADSHDPQDEVLVQTVYAAVKKSPVKSEREAGKEEDSEERVVYSSLDLGAHRKKQAGNSGSPEETCLYAAIKVKGQSDPAGSDCLRNTSAP
nr:PREDICTED: uncharacterized protein LOC107079961 [Lepisosteus oculatus]